MEIGGSLVHFGDLRRPQKMILLQLKTLAFDFDVIFKAYNYPVEKHIVN